MLARVQAGLSVLSGPPISLSTQLHPEEEAALSLRTGSWEDEAEQVKVTEKGVGGGEEERTEKHDTEEVYR